MGMYGGWRVGRRGGHAVGMWVGMVSCIEEQDLGNVRSRDAFDISSLISGTLKIYSGGENRISDLEIQPRARLGTLST